MEPQKPHNRRNVFGAVVTIAQAIVTLMFLMFAFYQKEEADTQRQMAEENRNAAQKTVFMEREQRLRSEKIIDSLTTELSRLKAIADKK